MIRRKGFTLVEVMAAISVGSVLLVLSLGVVHRALNLESNSRDQARVSHSLTRLSHDFRHDVQRAMDVDLGQEAALVLSMANESTVTYTIAEKYLLREQVLDDGVAQREFYDLPPEAVVQFLESEAPSRLELSITHDLKLFGVEPRPILHTVVEVGRLVRLSSPQEAER
ncbi:prepilin-type N-terminal cleavage/methylation domain-containing protein [Bythopirellula polymerisocia]|uniref:Prepilin-type N-terminal cleavage/methylation domain-containing protein n=1 Tax=Bythopirellula polymerisocia TaxID=2528003 RepID=A0A5C6CWG5_9BACT|nr:prepilin-type N-terminal cleavage/methylation domain-containing protein [Bythopirellula polymerisocia]TWU28054.1 hypothetical protein Pla144_13410 [Bythopirellula polymerisocia]